MNGFVAAGAPITPAQSAVNVPINFYEAREAFVIEMALPGYTSDAVHAAINGRMLKITAEPVRYETFEESKVFNHQFGHTPIDRTLELPDFLDPDTAEVTMADGLLRISIARRREEARQLPILDQHAKDDDAA
ncbi:MAG: Hsp20/alpha crystallin family protein [Armatimonadetes bacterium]|nr:Hsp20/alpha crystallin family protein [Armatimonadota bacterium]